MIYPQNFHTPKNNDISETPPKILKFKISNPQKWSQPTYIYENLSPPPSPPPTHTHILGASGCEKRTLQKIRLRKWHQLQLKYNSERASKWS